MTDRPQIFEALNAVMKAIPYVGKDERNEHGKWNFRGIDAVLNAAGPAFREHGVICVPTELDRHLSETTTSGGKATLHWLVRIEYRFYALDGSSVAAVVSGESMDWGDKGQAQAYSVAYRTALLQVLALPTTDQDQDSRSFTREAAPRPAPAPQYALSDEQWLALGAAGKRLTAEQNVVVKRRCGELGIVLVRTMSEADANTAVRIIADVLAEEEPKRGGASVEVAADDFLETPPVEDQLPEPAITAAEVGAMRASALQAYAKQLGLSPTGTAPQLRTRILAKLEGS